MEESKQVTRTRKMIVDALLSLRATRDFDNISVTDICDKAMITRATFYKYYEDKYHLIKTIVQDYKEKFLDKELKKFVYNSPKELYLKIAEICLDFVENHKQVLSIYLKYGFSDRVSMLILQMINEYIVDLLKGLEDRLEYTVPVSFLSKYFTGGFVYLGLHSVEDIGKYTKQQILGYLSDMLDVSAFAKVK